MLKMILSLNPNSKDFIYTPSKIRNINGIMVEGIDIEGIRKFKIFYPKIEIYNYYNRLSKEINKRWHL